MEPTPVFRIDDSIRQVQSDKLQKLRAKRDHNKATACLDAIKEKASTKENLMPFVVDAVENLCTLGEIADALRMIWGEYKG
jgi:methylmalonyl-CoA mutase N-terminal domain/subunit